MSTPTKSTPLKPAASKTPAAATAANNSKQDDPAKALEKLETKTKAVNANNIARVANSQLGSAEENLHPLMSLKTNRAIDRFPTTSKDIAKLSVTAVDAILLSLEAERTGKEQDKRERLRVQIGLKPNPA